MSFLSLILTGNSVNYSGTPLFERLTCSKFHSTLEHQMCSAPDCFGTQVWIM